MRELAKLALDTATRLGAAYADVRIVRYRRQDLASEDRRLAGFTDADDLGFGVRVLAEGAWGFAASGELKREEIQRVAEEAVKIAKASASVMDSKRGSMPASIDRSRRRSAQKPWIVPTRASSSLASARSRFR